MYSEMEHEVASRNGKILHLPGSCLPDTISEDDLFNEFEQFGVIDIELNQFGAQILFETIRGAAEAAKYVSPDFQPPMMVSPMMNGPMMNPMMNPMMGLMGPMGAMGMMTSAAPMPFGFPSRPTRVHKPQLTIKSPNNANIKVTSKTDGSRSIYSSPEKAAEDTGDDSELTMGQCTLCKKCTSYTCGRCGIFYCSRECQKQSWPTHMTECNLHMPPLNFAGRRNMTEVEINSCPWQQQRARENQGRQSPSGKQWRSRNDAADSSQERRSPQGTCPSVGAQANAKDERTQSSSFSRSNERAGGSERRFDERSSNRGSSSSSQRPEQRDERRGDGPRNFNRNRGDDTNFDRSRNGTTYLKASSNDSQKSPQITPSNIATSTVNGSVNGSPKTMPSNAAADDSPRIIPSNNENSSVSPKKTESNTVATLMRNLKLNVPTVQSFNQPDPVVSAPVTPKSNDVAPVTHPATPEDRFEKPACIKLTDGIDVVISHVDQSCVYVRAADSINQLAQLSLKLADHCASAPTLQRNPKKYELLAAKFRVDGNFYRAVVRKKLNDAYEVKFVDFGNPEQGVTKSEMISLTEDLAQVPCMAVEVSLKDVPTGFTGEALKILQSYYENETPLTLELDKDLAAGVRLMEKTGESFNVKILKALGLLKTPPIPVPVIALPAPVVVAPPPAPAPVVVAPPPAPAPVVVAPPPAPAPVVVAPPPAPAPVVVAPPPAPAPVVVAPAPAPVVVAPVTPQRRTWSLEDVAYVPFPPEGSPCSVLINHFHKDQGFFMACPLDMNALEKIPVLNVTVEDLAKRTQPYRPASNELCIAKWSDGAWYRAACLEPAGDDSFNVLFLEYGNSDHVKYPDIRPYAEELVQYPALSSICFLKEPHSLNAAQRAKVESMFHSGWQVEATVCDSVDEAVYLDIPVIKNALL